MAIGPGKYDDVCTEVREKTNATGVLLIITDGDKGSGFSCQAPIDVTMKLPQILRQVADDIERTS